MPAIAQLARQSAQFILDATQNNRLKLLPDQTSRFFRHFWHGYSLLGVERLRDKNPQPDRGAQVPLAVSKEWTAGRLPPVEFSLSDRNVQKIPSNPPPFTSAPANPGAQAHWIDLGWGRGSYSGCPPPECHPFQPAVFCLRIG
jgi:hypothetical protein